MTNTSFNANTAPEKTLTIQRVYIKDVSFESPQAPAIFQSKDTQALDLKLNVKGGLLDKDIYEVELQIAITATPPEPKGDSAKALFCIEVTQAGIFNIQNFEGEELNSILHTTCPTILYPYATALISDLASRATFMPLHLAPVNFEALYAERQKKPVE